MSDSVDILDSAFVAYSRSLPFEERVEHFAQCFINSGELYFELGSKMGTFEPRKLAEKIEQLPASLCDRFTKVEQDV